MTSQLEIQYLPSACELASRVENHIQRRFPGRIRNLHVSVRGEGLVLSGCSRTYHVKQLIQHAATEVCSIPELINEIEVI